VLVIGSPDLPDVGLVLVASGVTTLAWR